MRNVGVSHHLFFVQQLSETKYDDYCAFAQIEKGKYHLICRNANSFDTKFVELLEPLQKIQDNIILDGEIAIRDSNDQFQ